jgi:hypothetical protein
MFGTFPFTFVPAFFVPLALSLHALAMRSIGARLREVEPGSFSPRRVEHVS